MTNEQQEAYDAVEKINDELFEKYSKLNDGSVYVDWLSRLPVVSITFANSYTFISISIPSTDSCILPEILLYNSEDDDRIYYEKSDKYESFYKFIKRKFISIKEAINAVKL